MNIKPLDVSFETLHTHVPTQGLSPEGKDEIVRLVYAMTGLRMDDAPFKGDEKTALSKRVTKWISDNGRDYNGNLPTMIGNIANENAGTDQPVTFRFTHNLTWKAGDFGDDGSCFWGSNTAAMAVLRHYKAFAVQFFNKDGAGLGRCFGYMPSESMLVIFNSYGRLHDMDALGRPDSSTSKGRQDAKLSYVARILAEFLGVSYRSISLKNRGSDSGLIYINSGRGYMVADSELLKMFSVYDLDLDESVLPKCSKCGKYTDDGSLKSYKGTKMCPTCYSEYFVTCNCCDTEVPKGEALNFDNGVYFCGKKCASKMNYRECSSCGHIMPMEYLIYAGGAKNWVCPSCASRRFRTCSSCFSLFNSVKEKFVIVKLTTDTGKPYDALQCQHCHDQEAAGQKPAKRTKAPRDTSAAEVAPDPL